MSGTSDQIDTSVLEPVTLAASAARTATSTGLAAIQYPAWGAMIFQLDVTALGTDVGDILDCFVQTQLDDSNWVDIVRFTAVLGNGGVKRYIAKVAAGAAEAMFENATALAAGSVRNLLGRRLRTRFVITDAGTDDASFTFSVIGVPV